MNSLVKKIEAICKEAATDDEAKVYILLQEIKSALSQQEDVALVWSDAPRQTSYGSGMMLADIELDKDSSATVICHSEDLFKFETFLSKESDIKPIAYTNERSLKFRIGDSPSFGMMWKDKSLLADIPLFTHPQQQKGEL